MRAAISAIIVPESGEGYLLNKVPAAPKSLSPVLRMMNTTRVSDFIFP